MQSLDSRSPICLPDSPRDSWWPPCVPSWPWYSSAFRSQTPAADRWSRPAAARRPLGHRPGHFRTAPAPCCWPRQCKRNHYPCSVARKLWATGCSCVRPRRELQRAKKWGKIVRKIIIGWKKRYICFKLFSPLMFKVKNTTGRAF